MIPDIAGMITTFLVSKGYYKKGSKELAISLAGLEERIKGYIDQGVTDIKAFLETFLKELIDKAIAKNLEPFLPDLNSEQQTQINNVMDNLSTGVSQVAVQAWYDSSGSIRIEKVVDGSEEF